MMKLGLFEHEYSDPKSIQTALIGKRDYTDSRKNKAPNEKPLGERLQLLKWVEISNI